MVDKQDQTNYYLYDIRLLLMRINNNLEEIKNIMEMKAD